jgi:hypothetical protein
MTTPDNEGAPGTEGTEQPDAASRPSAEGVRALPPEATTTRTDIATAAVQTLPTEATTARTDIATAAVQTLPTNAIQEKKDIATAAVQTLPTNAADAKRDIATAAVQTLPTNAIDARMQIAAQAARGLPPDERDELCRQIAGPSQGVSDQIWLIIVAAFAIVFVFSTFGLLWAAYLDLNGAQTLLTVVTTVSGLLAGFISGRASTTTGTSGTGSSGGR